MNRRVRFACALVALCALVFSQLAVSAYACPMERGQAIAAPGHDGGESHCDDPQSPNLCDSHCTYGSSVTGHAAAAAPPFVAVPLPWRIEESSASVVGVRALAEGFLPFEPPPPLILFGTLRI